MSIMDCGAKRPMPTRLSFAPFPRNSDIPASSGRSMLRSMPRQSGSPLKRRPGSCAIGSLLGSPGRKTAPASFSPITPMTRSRPSSFVFFAAAEPGVFREWFLMPTAKSMASSWNSSAPGSRSRGKKSMLTSPIKTFLFEKISPTRMTSPCGIGSAIASFPPSRKSSSGMCALPSCELQNWQREMKPGSRIIYPRL
jgi:hypothetical protein